MSTAQAGFQCHDHSIRHEIDARALQYVVQLRRTNVEVVSWELENMQRGGVHLYYTDTAH